MVQVRETISRLNGNLTIRSSVGPGSKFVISIDRPVKA